MVLPPFDAQGCFSPTNHSSGRDPQSETRPRTEPTKNDDQFNGCLWSRRWTLKQVGSCRRDKTCVIALTYRCFFVYRVKMLLDFSHPITSSYCQYIIVCTRIIDRKIFFRESTESDNARISRSVQGRAHEKPVQLLKGGPRGLCLFPVLANQMMGDA